MEASMTHPDGTDELLEREPCPGCGDLGYTIEGGYRCCGGSEWECGASGCTGPVNDEQQVECPCGILRSRAATREDERLNMCSHGADRGSYCGYCGGYSQGAKT